MKRITLFLLTLLLIIPTCANAKTLNDYYDELKQLETLYNTNKNNKKLTQEQIQEINNEITQINISITNTRNEIKETEKEIEESKVKITDKKVETDGLLQFLQISNGGNVYLEYLFDAENYTDFIYRYEVVKQLSNYNNDLIKELEDLIVELNEKEKSLDEKNSKLQEQRSQLGAKLVVMQSNLDSQYVQGMKIEDDIKGLKEEIKNYENLGCPKDQDVDVCVAMKTASGWFYPLKKGCVTSEYTGDKDRPDAFGGPHYAIDLGCANEGTPVYAAADGVISKIIERTKCGGNVLYMTHIVKGKKYTTVYMHLLKYGAGIKKGVEVTKDTIIGYVGGYSTSTAHGGYDKCTTGAHLHFGMAEGHNYASGYSFNTNSINPREIFEFPKIGRGYFYR